MGVPGLIFNNNYNFIHFSANILYMCMCVQLDRDHELYINTSQGARNHSGTENHTMFTLGRERDVPMSISSRVLPKSYNKVGSLDS